jgi:NDP-sugar pyrophosphorylase family protein
METDVIPDLVTRGEIYVFPYKDFWRCVKNAWYLSSSSHTFTLIYLFSFLLSLSLLLLCLNI